MAAEPSYPDLPEHLLHGVGTGDFWTVGEHTVSLLQKFAALRPKERVLDIGSGLGRVAFPLSRVLDAESTYDGFDTLALYVDLCRKNLGLDPRRFRFHHFDLYSSLYNPNGSIRSESFRFPWAEGTFSLAIATSLFTHLTDDACAHYLREVYRTLAPAGRLYATFFVLDEHSLGLMQERPTHPDFKVRFAHGLYEDGENPEAAVAFDIAWLHQTFLDAGFRIDQYQPGHWRRMAGAEYQDVVVATRV